MKKKANLYLVGFMGSGKSTVGPMLATLLRAPFFDLDHLIEKEQGRSIRQMFHEEGEDYFREMERRTLHQTENWAPHVMALGGGSFESRDSRRLVEQLGVSVWLAVSLEGAWRRCRETRTRPLARDRKQFDELFQVRQQNYRKADIQVDTENRDPQEICREILAKLKEMSVY